MFCVRCTNFKYKHRSFVRYLLGRPKRDARRSKRTGRHGVRDDDDGVREVSALAPSDHPQVEGPARKMSQQLDEKERHLDVSNVIKYRTRRSGPCAA